MLLHVLTSTPWSVYTIFLLLVWLGVQRLSPGVMPVQRVILTPMAFIIWGVWSLLQQASTATIADWSLCALIGIALAVLLRGGKQPLRIDRVRGLIYRPGSVVPLIRNMSIFGVKYGLGVAAALHTGDRATLMLWSIAVSGVSAGYFFGWLLRLRRAWNEAAPASVVDVWQK